MNEELNTPTEPAKAVIRRNTEEAQGGGRNFDVFEDSSPMNSLITHPRPNTTCGNSSGDRRWPSGQDRQINS
jgi:hypothetical protein